MFRMATLPAGEYVLTVEAPTLPGTRRNLFRILVSQTARVNVNLRLATVSESITSDASQVDTSTNTLGQTMGGREVLDFTFERPQLHPAWLAAGGPSICHSTRSTNRRDVAGRTRLFGEWAAARVKQLPAGRSENNRIDGGFALKIPVDAVQEFRILTHTAPAEYGGYAGSTAWDLTGRAEWGYVPHMACSSTRLPTAPTACENSDARQSSGFTRTLLQGWQVNAIATANSGTPFTVYDSALKALKPVCSIMCRHGACVAMKANSNSQQEGDNKQLVTYVLVAVQSPRS